MMEDIIDTLANKAVWILSSKDSIEKEVQALSKVTRINSILCNNLDEVGKRVCEIEIESIEKIADSKNIEIIIIDYYWKELARLLFDQYGINTAKVFQWKDNNKQDFFLKEINCVPLFYGFDAPENYLQRIHTPCKGDNNNVHILFLSYYFPPIGGSPIQRTLKYVKYLSMMGYRITVVTVDDSNKEYRDSSLLDEIPKDVEVFRFPNSFFENETLSLENQKRIYRLLCNIDHSKTFLDMLYKSQKEQIWYPLPDRLILWAAEVFENIDKVVDMSSIDVLYSTVPEWSPHLLGYLIKQKYNIPWVADYRDPWAICKEYVNLLYPYVTENEYLWQRLLEQRLVSEMDALITIGEYSKTLYDQNTEYDISLDKIYDIPNGYDEQDFESVRERSKKNDKFTLCYNGSLGYSRKPQWVLRVISRLIQEGLVDKDKVCWIFNGPISKERFKEDVERYDDYGIAKNNGMLSHVDSIQIASNSDIMVVYGEYGIVGRFVYTGKFMEYLRIGRPILSFSSKDSPISHILDETNLGNNFLLEDEAGIRSFILSHYQKWLEAGNEKTFYNPIIEKFSRSNLAKRLADVFEKVRK